MAATLPKPPGIRKIQSALRANANPEVAITSQRFFKTAEGEYGAGDKFLGLRVPQLRQQVKEFEAASLETIAKLLASPYHEERLFALFLLVRQFERGGEGLREAIYNFYLDSTEFINNWDLVDSSAPLIVGGWLASRKRTPLYKLIESRSLWERRIAILSTLYFIRLNDYADTLSLCERVLNDKEDLIHKASGWMLREAGNREPEVLTGFLDEHAVVMPRTMLRYAIEKLTAKQRKHYRDLKQAGH